jgi:hypothetical protein
VLLDGRVVELQQKVHNACGRRKTRLLPDRDKMAERHGPSAHS